MSLSQVVQQHQATEYLEHVKRVGIELRQLLAAVDHLVPAFPPSTHRKVTLEKERFTLRVHS